MHYLREFVFNSILEQLGGEENLLAVGVKANSIVPVSRYFKDYGGYIVHGLSFQAHGKKVEFYLDLSDLYVMYVDGQKVKEDLYFDDLCNQVETVIGMKMPYSVRPVTLCEDGVITLTFARVSGPDYVE